MKDKNYLLYILHERNGEYEYTHYIPARVAGTKENILEFGEKLAKGFYENFAWEDDEVYYFNGGEVAVKYYSHKELTEEEFNVLNKYIL